MTVLTVIQSACGTLPLNRPDAIFASQEREHFELQVLANMAADHIAKDYEWQKLKGVATINGDGTTEDFNFPADYDRMLKKAELRTSRHVAALRHVTSSDQWLDMSIRQFNLVAGAWTIHGDQIHIKPAPANGEEVKYFYMSSKWALDSNATPKAAFSADNDTFRLSEKLLELCMIWKWRANKGLAYGEDFGNYEDAKEKLITADKGSRILTIGRDRLPSDAQIALPEAIVP
ncbi:phage adaptor protein [Taklimakanibacter deserti]|uniref:phage adaptor protein n=1 Tax=Taklimakanibacter deserti TaxID=2267839 RepID=UPI000E657634